MRRMEKVGAIFGNFLERRSIGRGSPPFLRKGAWTLALFPSLLLGVGVGSGCGKGLPRALPSGLPESETQAVIQGGAGSVRLAYETFVLDRAFGVGANLKGSSSGSIRRRSLLPLTLPEPVPVRLRIERLQAAVGERVGPLLHARIVADPEREDQFRRERVLAELEVVPLESDSENHGRVELRGFELLSRSAWSEAPVLVLEAYGLWDEGSRAGVEGLRRFEFPLQVLRRQVALEVLSAPERSAIFQGRDPGTRVEVRLASGERQTWSVEKVWRLSNLGDEALEWVLPREADAAWVQEGILDRAVDRGCRGTEVESRSLLREQPLRGVLLPGVLDWRSLLQLRVRQQEEGGSWALRVPPGESRELLLALPAWKAGAPAAEGSGFEVGDFRRMQAGFLGACEEKCFWDASLCPFSAEMLQSEGASWGGDFRPARCSAMHCQQVRSPIQVRVGEFWSVPVARLTSRLAYALRRPELSRVEDPVQLPGLLDP
jgi:hypothetical protein